MEKQTALAQALAKKARENSALVATLKTHAKNAFLYQLAEALLNNKAWLLQENQRDLTAAKQQGMSDALVDRLSLLGGRLEGLAQTVREVAALTDPIGEVVSGRRLKNGLRLTQQRVPLGVLFVIYEARPNVTIEIAALAIKSGNACLLRGGKEALKTNLALGKLIQDTLLKNQLPTEAVQVIDQPDRALMLALLKQKQYLDVVVPRGGSGLIDFVSEHSLVPVVKHDRGLCHLYLDQGYDLQKALPIILNAKTQRPGVCNAIETLLVHKNRPQAELATLFSALAERGVELRLAEELHAKFPQYKKATAADWDTEYLALILSVKTVATTQEAIGWINRYGSKHTEAILSNDFEGIAAFEAGVDAACVAVNVSTRFHDGGCFELGAEVGISNQKLHVRGPMTLRELTCLKYHLHGSGHIRE